MRKREIPERVCDLFPMCEIGLLKSSIALKQVGYLRMFFGVAKLVDYFFSTNNDLYLMTYISKILCYDGFILHSITGCIVIITVSEKGQVVIPASLRRNLGISAGTRLDIIPEPNGFKVLVDNARKTKLAADCIGITGYSGAVVSIDDMDVAKFAVK